MEQGLLLTVSSTATNAVEISGGGGGAPVTFYLFTEAGDQLTTEGGADKLRQD